MGAGAGDWGRQGTGGRRVRGGPGPVVHGAYDSSCRSVLSSTHATAAAPSGVECDLCGQLPIRGARYRSLAAPNFDLCADCRCRRAGRGGRGVFVCVRSCVRAFVRAGGLEGVGVWVWVWVWVWVCPDCSELRC